MEVIVSHGHSVGTFEDFAEDHVGGDSLKDYSTFFRYMLQDIHFHSYIIRILSLLQEHRAIEDEDDYQQFYEMVEYDEQQHINSLPIDLPEDTYFNFIELYSFGEVLVDYFVEEADIEEAWDRTVKSISLKRDRLTVHIF